MTDSMLKSADEMQRLFAEHAHHVRTLTSEAMKLATIPGINQPANEGVREMARLRAELAKANANVALAYAVIMGPEGVELALQALAEVVRDLQPS
jgi:hypothetical protein